MISNLSKASSNAATGFIVVFSLHIIYASQGTMKMGLDSKLLSLRRSLQTVCGYSSKLLHHWCSIQGLPEIGNSPNTRHHYSFVGPPSIDLTLNLTVLYHGQSIPPGTFIRSGNR